MKILYRLFTLLLFLSVHSEAQTNRYRYKRDIMNVTDTFHAISLPAEIFEKLNQDFSDLRIYGLTPSGDTLEAPYILEVRKEKTEKEDVKYKLFNRVHYADSFFYSLEVPQPANANFIQLHFAEENFDLQATLQGSNDGLHWFTITEKNRLVSIKNDFADYSFTSLSFGDSRYRYYKIGFQAQTNPQLQHVTVGHQRKWAGKARPYSAKYIEVRQKKAEKQTEIEVALTHLVPVSSVALHIQERYDYYRPVSIEYIADSIGKGDKQYIYANAFSGTLTSVQAAPFSLAGERMQKLRILIENGDDPPLQIDSVTVWGNEFEMIVRFPEQAKWYLAYGNTRARKPDYDLSHYRKKIPANPAQLIPDKEVDLQPGPQASKSLFTSKWWLWAMMVVIMIVLSVYALNLMREKPG